MRYVACTLLIFLAVSTNAQSRLTPREQRGRQIYQHGTSPSGSPLEARLAGDVRVAGSIVPCVNCHGHDGRGKREGGVVPSNITWEALTKPYGLTHPDGRTHPPYTEHWLTRAITMGIDPGGNALSVAMPRFQLSLADASDLVAYIRRLGDTVDPGLSATTVKIGVVLRSTPASGGARRALLGYFARVNGAGGIFGRRIELSFAELPPDPARRADAVRDFLQSEEIFAVVGDFSGAESEIAAVMRDTETPAIAAVAPFPETESPLNEFVFYLDGGVKEEAQALLDFASAQFAGLDRQIAIVSCDEEGSREAAKWLQARLIGSGRRRVVTSEGVEPVRADLVFWVRPALGVPRVIAPTSGSTAILVSGSLTSGALTMASVPNAQLFLARGTGSRPTDSVAFNESTSDRATASASIVTHALEIAGRGLSRGTFLETLEGFRRVQTNLLAPVSFGPHRRVGASGVRITMFDPRSQTFILAPGSGEAK